ncbi:Periplasmic alpha-galactoside-binding protein [Paenibacillus solanacearum]|uniref:Periplasmic alpha-galactoside-binding protein n=1 Tax=Paenibacillus solanacearum TaxID=2048548 RepID=A0A916K5G3_9BACL|nr:ABC transporter substrate-binding protein [Paenibacillus solanacearum]CAG7629292.1 Periplasmic alpha-galactoside-binding protein [Paenibacillus solanacearum]
MVKRFKFGLILLSFLLFAAACDAGSNTAQDSSPKPQGSEPVKQANKTAPSKVPVLVASALSEPPALADAVKSGSLPSLDKRIPAKEDVMVEGVVEEIGKYGGEWRMPWKGPNDRWTIGKPTEEALFRFKSDGSGVEPNVAKSYEVNADSTEFTIHLRKGMKWSDGVPFTADDVIFYWEHMLKKETFGKKIYDAYYSVDPVTGEKALAEVTKVDDYTFKVKHKYPSVLFLERVAIDNKWFFAPAHFQKTILPEFVGEEKALAIAKQWGFSDVKTFLVETGYYYWIYPQIPTLRAWHAKNDPNSDVFVMERNPYYWKVDEQGKQLPYIDRVNLKKIQDGNQSLLDSLAGNYDLNQFTFKDFTVLKENEKRGNYRVLQWTNTAWSSTGVELNQTTEDPKYRTLFQDIRFREALSVAVDRTEISEIITSGLGKPQQASVPKGLVGYQEGWDQQWAKYDVARANKLLDEIGLTKRDAQNFRQFADGSNLALTFYTDTTTNSPFMELIKKYYEAVGLKTDLKIVDQGTLQDLKYANKVPAFPYTVNLVNVAFRPDELVPLRVLTPWLGHYGLYTQSGGKEGVKPEGDVAKILEAWDKVKSAKNAEEITKWSNEIVKLHQKNQWVIGYTGPTPSLTVVRNNMRNVPAELVDVDEFRNLGHAHPAQFFFK